MYSTIEEANKASSESQWNSPHFKGDATTSTFKKRMELCRSCDNLTMLNLCSLCGCFMPIKTRIRKAACPASKWNAL